MANWGITTAIKVDGTPTALASEPCTKVTANTVYQITNTAKRVLDPTFNVVVERDIDGVSGFDAVDPNEYALNWFFGKVTFNDEQNPAAVIRIQSGQYIPTLAAAECIEVSCAFERAKLDKTVFHPTDKHRKYMLGKSDMTGKVNGLDTTLTDLDSGGGTVILFERWKAGDRTLLEVTWPDGLILRAWVVLDAEQVQAAEDGLVTSEVNFTCTGFTTDDGQRISYGWSDL